MFSEFPVSFCPWNYETWIEAGVKLNCANDTFGRTLYQCAPNEEKSSLVEFCLVGSIGRIEKGLCVHSISNGFLGVDKCDQFINGCPESSYISNEIYNYPACLQINKDEHCYQADPFCPNISRVPEFTPTMSDLEYTKNVVAVSVSTLFILGLLTGLILFYLRRRKNFQYVSVKDEESPNLDGETIANIEEYGIDYILKFQLIDEQHEDIAKMLRIPVEILRWPKDRLEIFVKDLREGETKVYNGRCMVVGCGEAGKTTLVNNMRDAPDENPESTISLDCHANVFKVVDKTLKVTTEEERLGPCTQICIQNMNENAEILNKITIQSEGSLSNRMIEKKDALSVDLSMEEFNFQDKDSIQSHESNKPSESGSINEEKTIEEAQQILIPTKSNEMKDQQMNAGDKLDVRYDDEKIKTQIKPTYNVKDTASSLKEREENYKKEEKRERNVIPVETSESKKISIMDFAGQSVYYACHHIYFSPRALFILVIDMSKQLDDKAKDSSLNQGLLYSGWSYSDYVRYWLGSIHSYSSPQVPVILVASHSEDILETELEYLKRIRGIIPSELLDHLSSNRVFKVKKWKDENTEKIKECIVDILDMQPYWGERIPTSWVSLEHILLRNKSSKVLTTDDIWEYVNRDEDCKIERKDDLLTALIFFNDIGVILFKDQGNLGQNIILDVQWFVNAFKCIIMDEQHKHMLDRPNHDWDLFNLNGILNRSLLEEAWKDSSFMNHKEELILHMTNLAMIAELPGDDYYVPCMNKQRYNPDILEGFTLSSTMCFMFQYLPLVIFHRLTANCMHRYGWKIWIRKTDYCIFHTATIFQVNAYKILIGVTENKNPCADKHPYSIELQVIALRNHKIELSESREIGQRVHNSLCELLLYYHHADKISSLFKIGYKCCKYSFGSCTDHTMLTIDRNEECVACKEKIDIEELTSYWPTFQPNIDSGVADNISFLDSEKELKRLYAVKVTGNPSDRSQKIIIAGIYIRSTYFSCVYTFKSHFDDVRSLSSFRPPKLWPQWSPEQLPAGSLLLTPEKKFHSYGFKAEQNYIQLVEKNKHWGWRFFRNFKMILHKNNVITKNTIINDEQGSPMLAVEVFSHIIRNIKKDLFYTLEKVGTDIRENELIWVIIIPKIWDPKFKEFWRVAANNAGISENLLEFAPESDAISLLVKTMVVSKQEPSREKDLTSFHPGTQYMILDGRDETLDIVVREVQKDRSLLELYHACGYGFSDNFVNQRILGFFEEVFGINVMRELRANSNYKNSWNALKTEIDQKKFTCQFDSKERLKISIPPVVLEIFKNLREMDPYDHINSTEHF